MDWQLVTGFGLALVFGLLSYAVKDMPRTRKRANDDASTRLRSGAYPYVHL